MPFYQRSKMRKVESQWWCNFDIRKRKKKLGLEALALEDDIFHSASDNFGRIDGVYTYLKEVY